jgi:hypothetical protein
MYSRSPSYSAESVKKPALIDIYLSPLLWEKTEYLFPLLLE